MMKHFSSAQINAPQAQAFQSSRTPLLGLGFRPFYLLAAIFAVLSVPVWLARYRGWLPAMPQLDLLWHMHEMVFGFALAVIIGFLLTAARNWTGLWTPRGWRLAALAGVWIAGRLATLLPSTPIMALIDLLFIPVAAWPLYVVIRKSRNNRNLPLLGILGLLFCANTAFHAARLGYLDIPPILSIHAAILVIVILETVMGGRVIPGFTANALPGSKPIVNVRLNQLALVLIIAAGLAWSMQLPGAVSAAFAFTAAIAQAWRLLGWKPWKTRRRALLWILHLSYGWIVIGLVLLGMAELGLASASTAFHALAIGSMAGLILGMITRTTLGHTGRPLEAGYKEISMYFLLQAGALARICANMQFADHRNLALLLAAFLWSSAFLLYLLVYVPYLCQSRLDGREG